MKTIIVLFVFPILVGVVCFSAVSRIPSPPPHAVVSDAATTTPPVSPQAAAAHPGLPDNGSASSADARPTAALLSESKLIQQILSDPTTLANVGKAAEFAQTLEPGELRDQVMNQIAHVWAVKSPEAATTWAAKRMNPEERDRLLEIIAAEREERDAPDVPESRVVEDLSEAVSHIAADNSKRVEVENLTQKWAVKNLPAALNWVQQQPAGEIRDNLIGRVAMIQSETAPAAAARLVAEQISPGPAQMEAALSVIHKWGLQDLAGAVAWVHLFPAGQLKERAVTELEGIASCRNSQHDDRW
jgi:hypothetical protein